MVNLEYPSRGYAAIYIPAKLGARDDDKNTVIPAKAGT